jgi:hypothetical protein
MGMIWLHAHSRANKSWGDGLSHPQRINTNLLKAVKTLSNGKLRLVMKKKARNLVWKGLVRKSG